MSDANDPVVKLTAHEDAVWQDGSNEPIRQAIFTNWPVNERGEFDENGKLLTEAELRQNGHRLLGRGENSYGNTHHIEVIPPLYLDDLEQLYLDASISDNIEDLLTRLTTLEGIVASLQAHEIVQDNQIAALQALSSTQGTAITTLLGQIVDLQSQVLVLQQTTLKLPSANARFATSIAMVLATKQYAAMRPAFDASVGMSVQLGKVYALDMLMNAGVAFQQDAIRRPPFIFGVATLDTGSSLSSSAQLMRYAEATLDVDSTTSGKAAQLMRGLSKLSASGSFASFSLQIQLWQAAATIPAAVGISTAIEQRMLSSALMSSAGGLMADLIRLKDGAALLATTGSLLATARIVKYGNALLAATGSFASAATTLSASTWSPTDQQFTALSSGNTIMNNNSVPPDIAVCRGTAGRGPGSGKRYFTMHIGRGLASKDHQGLGVATLSYGVFNGEVGINTGSWSIISNGGSAAYQLQNQGASVITTSVSYSPTDVVNVAFDAATGNLWFGVNGTYFNSTGASTGNPGAGTNPTFNVSTNTIYPIGAAYSSVDNILLTTNPTSGAPSGFTSWG